MAREATADIWSPTRIADSSPSFLRLLFNLVCQTPHCTHKNCKKCPLWTKDLDAIHAKEVRDAAVSEAARVEAESANAIPVANKAAAMFDDGDKKPAAVPRSVHVDVDRILRAP